MAIREEKEEKLVVVGVKRTMSCDKCGKEREMDGGFACYWEGWRGISAPSATPGAEEGLCFCPECYPSIYAAVREASL